MIKTITLFIMATLYVLAGSWHFVRPKIYLKIMPPYLPAPLFLVYLSGAIEMALGLMLYFPATRSLGAWGVIALLIAVFPANIYMFQKGGESFHLPNWALLARLPAQLLLMLWAWVYT
jgi:uncharacterized membrane protein